MTKRYPNLEGPTDAEIMAAIDELYPDVAGVYTDDQRKAINARARELMLERQKRRDGVH